MGLSGCASTELVQPRPRQGRFLINGGIDRPEETVELDDRVLSFAMDVNRMDLGEGKPGCSHVGDCFVECPIALVNVDDGQFEQNSTDMLQGFPPSFQNLAFIALSVDLEEDVCLSIFQINNSIQSLDDD